MIGDTTCCGTPPSNMIVTMIMGALQLKIPLIPIGEGLEEQVFSKSDEKLSYRKVNVTI